MCTSWFSISFDSISAIESIGRVEERPNLPPAISGKSQKCREGPEGGIGSCQRDEGFEVTKLEMALG